jgi:hypothetical protein
MSIDNELKLINAKLKQGVPLDFRERSLIFKRRARLGKWTPSKDLNMQGIPFANGIKRLSKLEQKAIKRERVKLLKSQSK